MAEVTAMDRLARRTAEGLKLADSELRGRMSSKAAPLIEQLSAHLIEAGGKRVRPALTLAAAELCGGGDSGVNRGAAKMAAAVEFVHTATLLHDDVVDESALRRGRPSANILYGNKPSVLVGDFLFARSFQLMVEAGSMEALRILADASATIAEGEVMQLATANNLATTEAQHLAVIRAKTAALFSAATETGAVLAEGSPEQREALRIYGDRLGVAFQMADDALDYGGQTRKLGKNAGDDFREGKVTAPVMIAFARAASEDEREFWRRTIEKKRQEPEDFGHALTLLTRHGAVRETIARARIWGEEAKTALEIFPPSELRGILADLVDYCVERAA